MFPLDLPIAVQDALVPALFVLALAIFIRRRKNAKPNSTSACRACSAAGTKPISTHKA